MATRERRTDEVGSFTAEERAAMKEHASELKAAKKRAGAADKAEQEERSVLEKIAEMSDADRALAGQVHALVKRAAPGLSAKLWYGMPAYAREGRIVCHFQPAEKFKTRYATFGFSDEARLDEGAMWPNAYAITTLDAADEARLEDIVRRAAG
jgi:uncharacterized protein YdhG (YjbR/CyaY superfamily)